MLFGPVCSVQRGLQPVPGLLPQPPPLPHGAVRRSHPRERLQPQVTLKFQIIVLKNSSSSLLSFLASMTKIKIKEIKVIKEVDVLLLLLCILFDICACFCTNYRKVVVSSAVQTCFLLILYNYVKALWFLNVTIYFHYLLLLGDRVASIRQAAFPTS